jgi:hypothetical protein
MGTGHVLCLALALCFSALPFCLADSVSITTICQLGARLDHLVVDRRHSNVAYGTSTKDHVLYQVHLDAASGQCEWQLSETTLQLC